MRTHKLLSLFLLLFLNSGISMYAQKEFRYVPKLYSDNIQTDQLKADLLALLKNVDYVVDYKQKVQFFPKKFFVHNDRIELIRGNKNAVIYFNEIMDCIIGVSNHKRSALLDSNRTKTDYIVSVNGLMAFWFLSGELDNAKDLGDALFSLQYKMSLERNDSLLRLFAPIAEKYRNLAEKPKVSEEQRRYIVQAELCTKEKDYGKAIELYRKAIAIDQTAYPTVYANLSLIYAALNLMNNAIYNMKLYLLLVPDGPDARAAQDKIYEWEFRMTK